ncbi:ABC transporter permease [Candidatus Dependentiae bacterium]|nr:ABC transporter permease [Candidatus Dependentiae bacterium]MBU4387385.1 ABC transporter permease [Candidatus Dependentiae bacterium]MCG2755889.1 ABC transporter permease [Candidatus Dependentiae bacterium]
MKFFKNFSVADLPFIFITPALIWQILFLYLPLSVLILNSFVEFDNIIRLSFLAYKEIFNQLYFSVIFNSLFLAFSTAFITFLFAYPVAYFISLKVKKYKSLFLFSLILPAWTSFIVQVYAWFFLLKKDGLFSIIFKFFGLFKDSTHLLNNYFAVQVGMAYCFLPFMIFPIYTVLEKMDKRLIEASHDLGANKFQTFMRVIFPISMPGVLTGFLLVLIPAFGEFAIPDLLGGGRKIYWGSIIVEKFLISRDWKSGAAITVFGVIALTCALIFSLILLRIVKKIMKNK